MMSTATSNETAGPLRRAVRRLTSDSRQRDDRELAGQSAACGASKIADCSDRNLVTVRGRIRSMTNRPRAGSPSLEAELWDGSGAVTLIWLGRRSVAGISPGQQLRAHGRVCTVDDKRMIYNPRYELMLPE